nr:immunoglobulin heavy chain junction region [Mus musculus]
LCKRRLCYGRL